jgi:hypothetical protein
MKKEFSSMSTPDLLSPNQTGNLSSFIMQRIKSNKLLSVQNFKFNLNEIFHQNRVSMNEFDKVQNKHKKILDKLYLESKNFATMYYKYKDSVKDIERSIRRNKLRPFSDDITQKKVDLIEKNHFKNNMEEIKNMFRPSPLLLEGNDLDNYYKSVENIQDINPDKDKNIKYSQKLLYLLSNDNRTQMYMMNRINRSRKKTKKKESPNKINKSIKNLQTYNNDIKKCLKMKEFNTMKFKKKGGSNQNLIIVSKIKRHFSPRNSYSSILDKNPKLNLSKKRSSLLMVDQAKNRDKFLNIFDTYEKIKKMPIDKIVNLDTKYYLHKFPVLSEITNSNQIKTIYNDIKKVKKNVELFNENEIPALRQMYYANAYDKRKILKKEKKKDKDINNLDKELINSVSRF